MIHRGSILTLTPTGPWYERDGALAINAEGAVTALGRASEVIPRFPGATVTTHEDALIVPGLIDLHSHYPQIDLIGAPSSGLLRWLEDHTFPHEERFADETVAEEAATAFCSELAAHGTTTAMVFSSSHEAATNALGAAFARGGGRAVIGKCSMDRHVPTSLAVPPERDLQETARLIARWHGHRDRIHYALTPRFAPACSEELLHSLGIKAKAQPDLYVQTHIAETPAEAAWVAELFPNDGDYLAVYERFGLVRKRCVLAHVIHSSDSELDRIARAGAGVAHCPTSNLFLGSGLFPFARLARRGIAMGLGTDVGAGTSFSLWHTMGEAYKVSMLLHDALTPVQLFHAATLGGAAALGRLDLGALTPGMRGDFVVLAPERSRLLARRNLLQASPADILFALMHHADDRIVTAAFVDGRQLIPPQSAPGY